MKRTTPSAVVVTSSDTHHTSDSGTISSHDQRQKIPTVLFPDSAELEVCSYGGAPPPASTSPHSSTTESSLDVGSGATPRSSRGEGTSSSFHNRGRGGGVQVYTPGGTRGTPSSTPSSGGRGSHSSIGGALADQTYLQKTWTCTSVPDPSSAHDLTISAAEARSLRHAARREGNNTLEHDVLSTPTRKHDRRGSISSFGEDQHAFRIGAMIIPSPKHFAHDPTTPQTVDETPMVRGRGGGGSSSSRTRSPGQQFVGAGRRTSDGRRFVGGEPNDDDFGSADEGYIEEPGYAEEPEEDLRRGDLEENVGRTSVPAALSTDSDARFLQLFSGEDGRGRGEDGGSDYADSGPVSFARGNAFLTTDSRQESRHLSSSLGAAPERSSRRREESSPSLHPTRAHGWVGAGSAPPGFHLVGVSGEDFCRGDHSGWGRAKTEDPAWGFSSELPPLPAWRGAGGSSSRGGHSPGQEDFVCRLPTPSFGGDRRERHDLEREKRTGGPNYPALNALRGGGGRSTGPSGEMMSCWKRMQLCRRGEEEERGQKMSAGSAV